MCLGVVNAHNNLKSVERPINLFDNHSPFQKSVFHCSKYILGDVLDKYVQKYEKIFSAKNCIFALECNVLILAFNFVIWRVLYDYIYSLKLIFR